MGAGGAPGENGGDTTAFGLTAYGAGAGIGGSGVVIIRYKRQPRGTVVIVR